MSYWSLTGFPGLPGGPRLPWLPGGPCEKISKDEVELKVLYQI